jgi:CRP-like cAMP-binding protein
MNPNFFSYGGNADKPAAAVGSEPTPAILGQLSDSDWEKFIGFTARRRYPVGAAIVGVGDAERALYFIVSGAVSVKPVSGTETALADGEVFGVLTFLDGAASAVTVVATGPAEVLRLTPEALEQLSAWQPRIALALLRDLGAHVAARLRRFQSGD